MEPEAPARTVAEQEALELATQAHLSRFRMSPDAKPEHKAPAGGIVRTCLDATWRTPRWILDPVDAFYEGQIPLDPCTHANNPTKAREFCAAPMKDGLTLAWHTFAGAWVNPPYGKALRTWLLKIAAEARLGARIVSLLPASRFEQHYFQVMYSEANMVCMVRGRVAFISSIDGAEVGGNPYASWIVGHNVDPERFVSFFQRIGGCYRVESLSVPPEKTARPTMTRGRAELRAKVSRCFTPRVIELPTITSLVTPVEAMEF